MKEDKNYDLSALSDRFVRFIFHSGEGWMGKIFKNISLSDYLVMSKLAHQMGIHEPGALAYLSDISKEMGIPMVKLSPMVHGLQAKGYVYWDHDGHGTYIRLSETGREAMRKQQDVLQQFVECIAERIGYHDLIEVMDLMSTLDKVMEEEAACL